jgi:tRNA threonylcarbamoyl adenosine modification protein (Sua5/YciO/YrdC/YwlC family)
MPGEIDKFSLVCSDLSHLSDYSQQISTPTFKLMKRLLPGAYTFILNANSNVPKFFRSKKKTVGIRVPNNAIARMLVEKLGNPIVSSSVIDDDEVVEYTTDPELIYERYQNEIDLLVDGGFGDNEASTVIDCTGDEWEVIRQGKGPTDGLFNN